MRTSRRRLLKVTGIGAAALSGCTSSNTDPTGENADVIAGPNGRLEFDPPSITVPIGTRIEWFFDSTGHNVSCVPEHSVHIQLPTGAKPFATHDPQSPRQLVPSGETYDHRFDTAGKYVYVCIPHISSGMVGEIIIE